MNASSIERTSVGDLLLSACHRGWNVGVSAGVHILALMLFPVFFSDLSVKMPKPVTVRIFEIPKPSPLIESEPVKPQAVQPVEKRTAEIQAPPAEPQAITAPTVAPVASAVEPVVANVALPAPSAIPAARVLSATSDAPVSVAQAVMIAPSAPSPLNVSQISMVQLKPRSMSLSSGGGEASTQVEGHSAFVMTTAHAGSPFDTHPRMPPSDIPEVQKAAVDDEELQVIEDGFASKIREKIAGAKQYPASARQARQQGKVVVAFSLSRGGDLLAVAVEQSSEFGALDLAALDAVKNAVPYPPIPEKLRREQISFKLPITFSLRTR